MDTTDYLPLLCRILPTEKPSTHEIPPPSSPLLPPTPTICKNPSSRSGTHVHGSSTGSFALFQPHGSPNTAPQNSHLPGPLQHPDILSLDAAISHRCLYHLSCSHSVIFPRTTRDHGDSQASDSRSSKWSNINTSTQSPSRNSILRSHTEGVDARGGSGGGRFLP
ncbi:hypothetical protein M413DRAFT_253636 [Hebeloma cylindrosporum]|uniref:Uncharacterized protein n=1 Tax=Hebeloma cylindrosporum TaxID=76867 RepID=A0A0C2Y9J2_HEBCY|nr:hypothetical protein M413DRAFT_253636 [Hebeloma cylindrosporum h7]